MYVNGLKVNLAHNISVSELLKQEGYDAQRVAIEKNGTIVPKKAFDTEMLCDSDKIEVVHFVGGG